MEWRCGSGCVGRRLFSARGRWRPIRMLPARKFELLSYLPADPDSQLALKLVARNRPRFVGSLLGRFRRRSRPYSDSSLHGSLPAAGPPAIRIFLRL